MYTKSLWLKRETHFKEEMWGFHEEIVHTYTRDKQILLGAKSRWDLIHGYGHINKDNVVGPLLFLQANIMLSLLCLCLHNLLVHVHCHHNCILSFNDVTFPFIASMLYWLPRILVVKYGLTLKYPLFVACHESVVESVAWRSRMDWALLHFTRQLKTTNTINIATGTI